MTKRCTTPIQKFTQQFTIGNENKLTKNKSVSIQAYLNLRAIPQHRKPQTRKITNARSLALAMLLSAVLSVEAKRTFEFGRPIDKRSSNLRRIHTSDNKARRLVQKIMLDTNVGHSGDAFNEEELFRPLRMTVMSVSYSYSYIYSGTNDEISYFKNQLER